MEDVVEPQAGELTRIMIVGMGLSIRQLCVM